MPHSTRLLGHHLRVALRRVAWRAPAAFVSSRHVAKIALLVCVCAALALTATALAASAPANESLAVFEGQLDGHQVSTVTLHTKAHTFHASLTDGRKVSIAFSPSQQQRLVQDIRAKGITVKVAKVQPPPSHKLRYIVGGIAIVVVVLAVAGFVLLARRRRMREEEEGPRAPAGYAASE